MEKKLNILVKGNTVTVSDDQTTLDIVVDEENVKEFLKPLYERKNPPDAAAVASSLYADECWLDVIETFFYAPKNYREFLKTIEETSLPAFEKLLKRKNKLEGSYLAG